MYNTIEENIKHIEVCEKLRNNIKADKFVFKNTNETNLARISSLESFDRINNSEIERLKNINL